MKTKRKKSTNKFPIILLMCLLGTCMHFVCDIVTNEAAVKVLGLVFPVNETSWEHMKMIWYPFLGAGLFLSLKEGKTGYLSGMPIAGLVAMFVQLGTFAFYQSFTGVSNLMFDIVLYMSVMIFGAMLGFLLSARKWAGSTWILWVLVSVGVTAAIIYLTFNPGPGYVFLDNAGLGSM